jgi:hypothetical protein
MHQIPILHSVVFSDSNSKTQCKNGQSKLMCKYTFISNVSETANYFIFGHSLSLICTVGFIVHFLQYFKLAFASKNALGYNLALWFTFGGATTLSITALSILTFSIMTPSMKVLFATPTFNNIQHKRHSA